MPGLTVKEAIELALRHQNAGRLQEAESVYQQVLVAAPDHPDALHLLGLVYLQAGQHEAGLDLIRRAIAVNDQAPEFHSNLGYALGAIGRTREAIAAYRRALELQPNLYQAYNNLGNALREVGEFDEAVAIIQRGLAIQPNNPDALNSLGCALRAKNENDQAITAFEKALSLRPEYPEAHNNLGNTFRSLDQYRLAMAHFERALSLRPDSPEIMNNVAGGLEEQGKFDDAISMYRRAVAAGPQNVTAHVNLGIALLRHGNFDEGWTEYAWRWRGEQFPQPTWDGESLPADRRLLLHAEQGLGDSIQFLRYLPLAAERAASIILQIPNDLKRLAKNLEGFAELITESDPLPIHDVRCPLMSLPLIFNTSLETIPASVPYLMPPEDQIERWRHREEMRNAKTKIGLVWAGRREYANDRRRSLDPGLLEPLTKIPNIKWFSLQKGDAAQHPPIPDMIDWTTDLHDLADTAALIANLDLVISVDTAVAHLAGAMGKRVWTLLPFVPDWRWLLDRSTSPWYPTMRLFRQPRIGDWPAVIDQLAESIRGLS